MSRKHKYKGIIMQEEVQNTEEQVQELPPEPEMAKSIEAPLSQESDKDQNMANMRATIRNLTAQIERMKEANIHEDEAVSYGQFKKLKEELGLVRDALLLHSKHNDYHQVVNPKNEEELKKHNPQLFEALYSTPSAYQNGLGVYHAIKLMKAAKGNQAQAQEKLEQNKKVPNLSPENQMSSQVTNRDNRTYQEKKAYLEAFRKRMMAGQV